MGDYVSTPEMRSHLGIADNVDDTSLDRVISTAERAVDDFCGQTFTLSTSGPRMFVAHHTKELRLRTGIGSAAGVIVQTDADGDGTFETTITSTDVQLEPLDGIGADGRDGWPYTVVRLIDASWPLLMSGRPGVQITARWGWAAVPSPVKEATLLLAAEVWALRDAPLGTGRWGAGALRVEDNAGVVGLLGRYRRAHAIAGMA